MLLYHYIQSVNSFHQRVVLLAIYAHSVTPTPSSPALHCSTIITAPMNIYTMYLSLIYFTTTPLLLSSQKPRRTITAMEQKILAHMNQDHKLALQDYLAVYGGVRITNAISNIKLKAISNDSLLIAFTHRDVDFEIEKPIALDPPLGSLGEARERLVEMAKYAADKRGYSHKQIKEILYPTKIYEFVLLGLVWNLIISWYNPHYFYCIFLQKWLGILGTNSVLLFLQKYNNAILYTTAVLHVLEAAFVMAPLLAKYRVPIDYRVEWLAATVFEGFPAVLRFKSLTK